MKVTITVEGRIESKHEKIDAILEVPDGWNPDFNEYSKVKGVVRFPTEKMAQNFEPKGSNN